MYSFYNVPIIVSHLLAEDLGISVIKVRPTDGAPHTTDGHFHATLIGFVCRRIQMEFHS